MTPRTAAASATVRPCGPTVSCVCEIGITPARLVRPTVGLMPTTPQTDDGHTIEPSVSEPNAAAARLADTAATDPELEPHGLWSSTYGLFTCRPRPLQPLEERVDRKFAHSLSPALPNRTAPASRSLAASVESCWTSESTSAREPAAVRVRSAVSMLSLSRIGM